jgi:hypothetical protein
VLSDEYALLKVAVAVAVEVRGIEWRERERERERERSGFSKVYCRGFYCRARCILYSNTGIVFVSARIEALPDCMASKVRCSLLSIDMNETCFVSTYFGPISSLTKPESVLDQRILVPM